MHIDLLQGLQTFLYEGHISKYTTVRGPGILQNEIVLKYVAFYQINKIFVNIYFFIFDTMFLTGWNGFAGRIGPAARSLETQIYYNRRNVLTLCQLIKRWIFQFIWSTKYNPNHLVFHGLVTRLSENISSFGFGCKTTFHYKFSLRERLSEKMWTASKLISLLYVSTYFHVNETGWLKLKVIFTGAMTIVFIEYEICTLI